VVASRPRVAHRPEAFNGGRVAGESDIWRGAFIFFFSHGGSYKLAEVFFSVACEMLGRGAWRMHGTGLTLSMSQVFWTGGSSTKRRDLAG